ncbi:MAG: hypothetical protein KA408_01370 [Flavobacteriales bacterium]|nr:hypothetical protein [Flavobacteriales bacterium]
MLVKKKLWGRLRGAATYHIARSVSFPDTTEGGYAERVELARYQIRYAATKPCSITTRK